MCGFVGYISGSKRCDANLARSMANAISHRGPDDDGVFLEDSANFALAHRRLSIVDLSPHGHQPMPSACGRYVIAFNGEIYNHALIRIELEHTAPSIQWRGHSDTEVILAAIACWGLAKAIGKFIGMFAFALWDRQEKTLSIARDRLGEKPLYYGFCNRTFLFGSELKALRQHPDWSGSINSDSLSLFLRHNYIPAPYSIYKDIFKLLPGTSITLTQADINSGNLPKAIPYWSMQDIAQQDLPVFQMSGTELVDQLENLLKDAISMQMMADVPLGAFLSGGIDSSLIVALMQVQSMRPVKTFTIGFHEREYNEANHAMAVARHLGTEHTELYVSPEEAREIIPKLPLIYDEPFADSSQIPTILVSQLARQHVTVSLSGDGGDELFGGYNRYTLGQAIWQRIGWLPLNVRTILANLLRVLPPQRWDAVFRQLAFMLPAGIKQRTPGDKLHKLAAILPVHTPEQIYHGLVSHWNDPASIVLGSSEPLTVLTDKSRWANLKEFTERMMYMDTVSYLPDDILTKVDRAAMSVSLETRVPLLDHRVVEFAWQIPLAMKIRNHQGKWPLRQILYKYVPKELIERPKMGFGVPLNTWLRGPLRPWAENLLDESRLKQEGFFDAAPIREKWSEHLSGHRNWQYHLWDILMFQSWLESQ